MSFGADTQSVGATRINTAKNEPVVAKKHDETSINKTPGFGIDSHPHHPKDDICNNKSFANGQMPKLSNPPSSNLSDKTSNYGFALGQIHGSETTGPDPSLDLTSNPSFGTSSISVRWGQQQTPQLTQTPYALFETREHAQHEQQANINTQNDNINRTQSQPKPPSNVTSFNSHNYDITACSGNCKNTIMRCPTIILKAVMNSKMDVEIFEHENHWDKKMKFFWTQFIDPFKNNWKDVEDLCDFICFVGLIYYATPISSKNTDRLRLPVNDCIEYWPKNKEHDNDELRDYVQMIINKSQEVTRIEKIKEFVKKIYPLLVQEYENHSVPNECVEDFVLRCLMYSVVLYQATKKREDLKKDASKLLKEWISNDRSINDLCEMRILDCNPGNLNLMKMIVLVIDFLLGIDSLLPRFTECLHDTDTKEDETKTDEWIELIKNEKDGETKKLLEEIKRAESMGIKSNKKKRDLLSIVKKLIKDVPNFEESIENEEMGECGLTRSEILANKLTTIDAFSKLLRDSHKQGDCCFFRCLSQNVFSGIEKLKRNKECNQKNMKCKVVYHGIRGVRMDRKALIEQMPLCGASYDYDEECISDNVMDMFEASYSTLLSATKDIRIALGFAQAVDNEPSIIFEISLDPLRRDDRLLYADISQISYFPGESEVRIMPAKLNIERIDVEHMVMYKDDNLNDLIPHGTEIYRVKMEPIMRRSHINPEIVRKNKDIKRRRSSTLTESQTALKMFLLAVFETERDAANEYFDIMRNNGIDNLETATNLLNHKKLEEIGITKPNHQTKIIEKLPYEMKLSEDETLLYNEIMQKFYRTEVSRMHGFYYFQALITLSITDPSVLDGLNVQNILNDLNVSIFSHRVLLSKVLTTVKQKLDDERNQFVG